MLPHVILSKIRRNLCHSYAASNLVKATSTKALKYGKLGSVNPSTHLPSNSAMTSSEAEGFFSLFDCDRSPIFDLLILASFSSTLGCILIVDSFLYGGIEYLCIVCSLED